MASWSLRRQLFYAAFLFGGIIAMGIWIWQAFFVKPPTCTDQIQNGGENGVDCGGACRAICPIDSPIPAAFWARTLSSGDRTIDLAAFLENEEASTGHAGALYTFRVYDDRNQLVVEHKGKTFVNPREQFAVVVPNIAIGSSTPKRTFIEFSRDGWERVALPDSYSARFSYHDQILSDVDTAPRLRASVRNESSVPAQSVEVTALLYDANQVLVGAGVTYIDKLARNTEAPVVFVWRKPFAAMPVKIEIVARMSAFLNIPE